MIERRRFGCMAAIRATGIIAFLLSALVSESRAQQNPPPIVVSAGGTEFFRDLLFEARIQPINNLRELVANPRDTMLVVFGSTTWLDQPGNSLLLQNYLRAGGAILICSDRPSGDGLLQLLNMRIDGARVRTLKEADCYRGDENCPYVAPFVQFNANANPASPRRVFAGDAFLAGKVACNVSSVVRHGQPMVQLGQTIETLAGYPESSKFANGNPLKSDRDYFAVGGTFDAGRYLVLADDSVFINWMMFRKSLQNLDFGRDVIRWMGESRGNEKRTKCLFVEDGQFQTDFSKLAQQEIPWWAYLNFILATQVNPLIAEMESKNYFNELLINKLGYRQIVRGWLLTLMGFVLLYGLRWSLKRRHRVDSSIHLAAGVVGQIPRGGVLQQRQEALLACGSLFEAFRQRARDRFLELNGAPNSEGAPPAIEVDDSFPDAKRLRGQVLEYWDMAFADQAIVIKAEDWESHNLRLRHLIEDAADGLWRFEPHSTTT